MSSHPVSFVTCVNDREVYSNHILKSLSVSEEGPHDAIAIFNPPSAAKGLNEGMRKAENDIVTCIHQDVFLSEDFVDRLFTELEKIPTWGALGLAGCGFQGENLLGSLRSIWPYKEEIDYSRYYFKPIPAQTLDCLCIVLDRRNGIWFDEGFTGFHMYGEDFALQANDMGLGAYVIFNPIFHDSRGLNVHGWDEARMRIIDKWRDRCGSIHTTTGSW